LQKPIKSVKKPDLEEEAQSQLTTLISERKKNEVVNIATEGRK
jgi:hypothetical protein